MSEVICTAPFPTRCCPAPRGSMIQSDRSFACVRWASVISCSPCASGMYCAFRCPVVPNQGPVHVPEQGSAGGELAPAAGEGLAVLHKCQICVLGERDHGPDNLGQPFLPGHRVVHDSVAGPAQGAERCTGKAARLGLQVGHPSHGEFRCRVRQRRPDVGGSSSGSGELPEPGPFDQRRSELS
jgi:hypothetical protein